MGTPPFIVVIEDNDEDFDTVLEAARRFGMARLPRRAGSGGECLQLLQALLYSRSRLPDLVLLDLNTPGDDGRETLRQIKASSELRAIPAIVLSTSTNPRDVDFCYANHANAYHTKPVSHTAHLKTLQDIFSYWLGCALLATGPLKDPP